MSPEKTLSVIETIIKKLEKMNVKPKKFNSKNQVHFTKDSLSHSLYMLYEMKKFVNENRMDKVFRWLGFVQGVLWVEGVYTVDQMKNHNRSD